jgi:hypothetical protein
MDIYGSIVNASSHQISLFHPQIHIVRHFNADFMSELLNLDNVFKLKALGCKLQVVM